MQELSSESRRQRRRRIVTILESEDWYGGLPAELKEAILDASHELAFARGGLVVQQGEESQGLFAVLEGHVAISRWVTDEREVLIHIGEPGLWLGDLALMAEKPAAVTITAHTDARLLLLPAAAYRRLVEDRPERFRAFVQLALDRYGLLLRTLADTQALTPMERLRSRLRSIVELDQKDGNGAGPIEISATQAQLAEMIGVSRQTLHALLHRLESEGAVEVGFKGLVVPDLAKLND